MSKLQSNVCLIKIRSKLSSVLLLCLLRNFMRQTLRATDLQRARVTFKGQIISEQNCGVLNFPKMQRNIARVSALASKMGQIKKIKTFHYNE